jgi:hypothetical protein
VEESGVAGVQEHPTGKAREDLRSKWRAADLALAEKFRSCRRQFKRFLGENIGIASFGLRIFRKNELSLFCNF